MKLALLVRWLYPPTTGYTPFRLEWKTYSPTVLLLLCCLYLTGLVACGQPIFRIDSLPQQGVLLDRGWKFHLGDNPAWAKPDFDDSGWDTLNPTQKTSALHKLPQQGIGWLRIYLHVAPALRGKLAGMYLEQAGATEFFLNGKSVVSAGKISARHTIERGSFRQRPNISFNETDSIQVLAVRYAFSRKKLPINRYHFTFFSLRLRPSEIGENVELNQTYNLLVEATLFGVFLVLGLLQLLLFKVSNEQRAALSLGLFLITQGFVHLMNGALVGSDIFFFQLLGTTNVLVVFDTLYIGFIVAISISSFYYLLGIHQYFGQPRKLPFYVAASISFLTIPTALLLTGPIGFLPQYILAIIIPWLEILRIGIIALKKKKTGARLFTLAHTITLTVFIGWTITIVLPLMSTFLSANGQLLFIVAFLGLAVTISLLLSQERSAVNQLLRKQLIELEALSQKNLAQEQEKQQILAFQNERLEQQVEARTAELKASQTQLIQKEKLASLGELTAGIAHEIQNPLNFVNNFSEVSAELVEELQEGPFLQLPESEKEYAEEILGDLSNNLQKIHHHGGRAAAIVRGMLEHARTESGERRPTDLNALCDEYLKIAYHGLRAKDKFFTCELATDFDPTLKPVEVAPQEIGRVLLNLYNNAFYAMSERARQRSDSAYEPTVWVSTKRISTGVEIRVRDNGTGIPESVDASIFQPFFTTKPTGEGTGLGLSLSYDIVTKGHGGALTVESAEGEGTTFSIQLPILSAILPG